MIFASAGYRVAIYDVEEKQLRSAKDDIQHRLLELEKEGMIRGKLSAEEQFHLVEGCQSLAQCVHGAIHIQVNIA